MSENLIYGKTINLLADQVDFTETPLVLPDRFPNTTTPLSISHASELILPLTGAAGSARTDPGVQAVLHFKRINDDVYVYGEFPLLAVTAPANNTGLMTFNETVPANYRPASILDARVSYSALVDGVIGPVVLRILHVGGTITIGGGDGSTPFTVAMNCAVNDQTSFGYVGDVLA